MTTALITGLTGMTGSHLAEYLLANTDWDIVGVVRFRSPLDNLENLIPRINAKDRVSLVYGELRDFFSIQAAVKSAKPDYIFHLASQSYAQSSAAAPLDTIETNTQGTANLLEAVRQDAPHAVFHNCSTSEVFGRVPKELVPIKEDCPFHPASVYAISKVGAELLGRHYAQAYGMRVVTSRSFTKTGPRRGEVFAESSFAKQIALIEAGFLPPVIKVGNLDSLRTFADVRDIVRAYVMLATIKPRAGEVYNFGGNHICTIGNVLDLLIEQSSRKGIAVEVDPSRLRPVDANLQIPDGTKFHAHTGWQPQIPFAKTMGDLLDYWRVRVAKDGNAFLQR